jgi:aspartate 1-decarboxylase
MFRIMHKSKIHGATVTEANLNYKGSITVDPILMEAADMLPDEKVLIVNNNNGQRFETYIIKGEYGSGTICLNGAAARLVQCEDKVIIISFGVYNDSELKDFKAKVILVDEKNRIIK